MRTLHLSGSRRGRAGIMNLLGVGRAPLCYYMKKPCAPAGSVRCASVGGRILAAAARGNSAVHLRLRKKTAKSLLTAGVPCSPLWMIRSIHSGSISGAETEMFAMLLLGIAMWRYSRAPKTRPE